jgi:hypothetical protein
MPHNVKVIRGSDFIRAKPEGQVDLAMAEKLLKAIADAGAGLEDFDVLVDIRRISGALKPSELWSLAQTLASYRRKVGNRTAVLCPLERFDNVRFFALCAENQGMNVHAFTSYETAMEWLITGDTV